MLCTSEPSEGEYVMWTGVSGFSFFAEEGRPDDDILRSNCSEITDLINECSHEPFLPDDLPSEFISLTFDTIFCYSPLGRGFYSDFGSPVTFFGID